MVCFQMTVRPKRLAAQAKQTVIICASSSECATRAQSYCIQKIPCQQLSDFGFGIELVKTEDSPISSVVDIDAKIIVVKGNHEHGCIEYVEKQWSQDTALLSTVANSEQFREPGHINHSIRF